MSKRGRRDYTATGIVPFSVIGERLGITQGEAQAAFNRGMSQIANHPGALQGLGELIREAQTGIHPIVQARSLECQKEFRVFGYRFGRRSFKQWN